MSFFQSKRSGASDLLSGKELLCRENGNELMHVENREEAAVPVRRTLKQAFGEIRDSKELFSRFVFYTPAVHHLISRNDPSLSTDVISRLLSQAIEEHPLVITDLQRPVFRFDEVLTALEPGLKHLERELYAVPREIWERAQAMLLAVNLFDLREDRFCVLSAHKETIVSPIGKHNDLPMEVWYFNCFSNKETYCFAEQKIRIGETDEFHGTSAPPKLKWYTPLPEFVRLAEEMLSLYRKQSRRGQGGPEENVVRAAEELERHRFFQEGMELSLKNKVMEKAANPLKESELNPQQREQCYEIIRQYEAVFGSQSTHLEKKRPSV
jgi:hypothetical protein